MLEAFILSRERRNTRTETSDNEGLLAGKLKGNFNFLWLFLISFFSFRPKARSASSIILRGANDFMLDEMERSMHDAICVVKRVLESKTVVPGGGAVEAALSIYLENFATSLVRRKTFPFHCILSSFFAVIACSADVL